jgi:hypothetical protein
MSEIVKRKIDAGVIRPSVGMDILGAYTACFNDTTYCDVGGPGLSAHRERPA